LARARAAQKLSESIYHSENGASLLWTNEQELTMALLRSFLADESAATAIEYCLIAAGIALAIVTVVNNTGSALLNNKFNSIDTAMK
jgi:pilus assembly protein Flp/PilA